MFPISALRPWLFCTVRFCTLEFALWLFCTVSTDRVKCPAATELATYAWKAHVPEIAAWITLFVRFRQRHCADGVRSRLFGYQPSTKSKRLRAWNRKNEAPISTRSKAFEPSEFSRNSIAVKTLDERDNNYVITNGCGISLLLVFYYYLELLY